MQFLKLRHTKRILPRRPLSHIHQRILRQHSRIQFSQTHRHIQTFKISHSPPDPLFSRLHIIILLHAPHLSGILSKPCRFFHIHILCPCLPDSRQTGPMSHIEFCTELMSYFMRCEILFCPKSCDSIMGQAAAPHQLTHSLIIRLVLPGLSSIFNHSPQKCFRNLICHPVSLCVGKIPVQRMHHNIHNTACHLIFRQRVSKLRVHNSKFHPVKIRAKSLLPSNRFIRQHRGVTHLAACCRNGQDNPHRKTFCKRHLLRPNIPKCSSRICCSVRNTFCRINGTSPTHSQNKIRSKRNRSLHASLRKRQSGVWLNPAPLFEGDPRIRKFLLNVAQQTSFFHTAAPIDKKHSAAAPLPHFCCSLLLRIFSKHHFCRRIINKFLHIIYSPF